MPVRRGQDSSTRPTRNFPCTQRNCQKAFFNNYSLRRHLRLVHRVELAPSSKGPPIRYSVEQLRIRNVQGVQNYRKKKQKKQDPVSVSAGCQWAHMKSGALNEREGLPSKSSPPSKNACKMSLSFLVSNDSWMGVYDTWHALDVKSELLIVTRHSAPSWQCHIVRFLQAFKVW
jgi:hypothetical protein